MRTAILLVILAMLVGLIAGCANQATTEKIETPPSDKEDRQISATEQSVYTHGPEDAKVHIEAFYPLNEKHMKIVAFLNALADRYPGKVKVTATDFRTDEGGEKTMAAFGKICGGIQINGESNFTVMLDGKETEVTTMMGEWVNWTKPEVAAALDQVVQKEYPGTEALPFNIEEFEKKIGSTKEDAGL